MLNFATFAQAGNRRRVWELAPRTCISILLCITVYRIAVSRRIDALIPAPAASPNSSHLHRLEWQMQYYEDCRSTGGQVHALLDELSTQKNDRVCDGLAR
jgi:hypothetical protein